MLTTRRPLEPIPFFNRQARYIEIIPAQRLKLALDIRQGQSKPFRYLLESHALIPAQSCQLREIMPWLPPPDRVFFNPSQRFFYYRTAGTTSVFFTKNFKLPNKIKNLNSPEISNRFCTNP